MNAEFHNEPARYLRYTRDRRKHDRSALTMPAPIPSVLFICLCTWDCAASGACWGNVEVQVAITMKESLGQNHARNRLSAKSYRCSILELGEPGDSAGNGITTREILKLSQLCGPGSAICDAGWPTPDCPWSMSVRRSQKKYFWNFNFNFNYRELLSKSATFSLRGFGVVSVSGTA